MGRLKNYFLVNFEQTYVLLILVSVAFINYYIPQKVAFINFYFLPVIAAGYFVGIRLSVLGAVFCVLLVATYTILYPQYFTMPNTKIDLYLHVLAWGSFLILAGAVVGRLQEKLKLEIEQTRELNEQLLIAYENVKNARAATMLGLAKLAEYRDADTGAHLERIREYCKILASELSKKDRFRGYITEEYIDDIYLSSILHDIGKVGVPDSILLKPGELTPTEYAQIKRHTTLGGDTLKAVESQVEGRSFLTLGTEIAYYHQEKWDGTGYPRALKGEEIPLSARIVALADAYDALTSARVYKEPLSHEESAAIIAGKRATHFDPDVVDAFLARAAEFDRIRTEMQDSRGPVALTVRPGITDPKIGGEAPG